MRHPENGFDVEQAVAQRYSAGARRREEALCCPSPADPALLAALPAEVIERDYGCGDPTAWLAEGERVLDLGSGSGKACFLAAQVVGPRGSVLGLDANADMLALARGAASEVARRIGYANVAFRRARIQDLRLDLEAVDRYLAGHPARSADDLQRVAAFCAEESALRPLVPDASVDVVVSNCVLNLVRTEDKRQLFAEIHRVLRRGGRAVVSDIVCDEDVPDALRRDPELWTGCIAGAFREDLFLAAFEEAGLHGVTLLERQAEPWRVVQGIEFRSVTVAAWKGKEGPCLDARQAVVYRGPFRSVQDDDGHELRRGVRTAVCEKTFRIFSGEPYRAHVELIEPAEPVPPGQAPPFPCTGGARVRSPRETKRAADATLTTPAPVDGCGPAGCC